MKYLFHLLISIAFVTVLGNSLPAQQKLDLNDLSWLWPVPTSTNDLTRIISMDNLKSSDGLDVWSNSQFQDLVKVVDSGLTKVGSDQVEFGSDIRQKSAWKIAGMRVDPSVPGCNVAVREAMGSLTQIRLIVQPVTSGPGNSVVVHDVAVHLVFQWTLGVDDKNRRLPDNGKFKEIVADLDRLKSLTESGGGSTAGKPLGVHPGLLINVGGLDDGIQQFLQKHLSNEKLDSMALMGIQSGVEPWFFFATKRLADGHFGKIPVPIPSAEPQMIDFRSGGTVSPKPVVDNRSPINSKLIVPIDQRRGVATAALFVFPNPEMNAFAEIGVDNSGNTVRDTEVRNRDIPDVVANPLKSHFFNTDCISCHTETRRRMNFGLSQGSFAFKPNGRPPEIVSDQLPKHDWNVRNFGWFPPHRFIGGGRTVATVTQRTANETAEVVEFIERNFRGN